MKNALLIMLLFFLALLFAGCEVHIINNKNVSNDNINMEKVQTGFDEGKINKIIEKSFLFDFGEEYEIPAPLDLSAFSLFYSQSNKYIVSLKKNNFSNVFAGYLSTKLLDILDNIDVPEKDDNLDSFIWSGINNYLKKYKYAIKNGLIDYETNKIKWIEYSNEYEVLENFNEMFLVCKVGYMEIEFIDFNNNAINKEIIVAELDAIDFFKELMTDKNYLAVVNNEIDNISITSYDLIKIAYRFNSFLIEDINGVRYIDSREKDINKEFECCNYYIKDYYYFYDLTNVIKIIEDGHL